MIEEITERFINRIKKMVITDEKMTSIPLAYLKTLENLPESIMHFLDQEVELWLREEENKFSTTERFDYDMPEVRMLIDQIFDLLKQNATFHITKFNQLIERAVKLEMNYLIEPHRTLTQFIFKDSPIVSTIEVYDTLKYFFRYEYYKEAISDYFNLKFLREISEDQFVDLINQIDEKAFSEDRANTTLKTIKTIMAFLGEAQDNYINSLSVDLLYAALKDRNLDDYVKLVERLQRETRFKELTFEQIEALIKEGIIPGIGKEEVKAPESVGLSEHEDIETSKPEVSVEEIEVQESKVDVAEIEEEEFEEEVYEEEEVEEEAVVEKPNIAQDLADHVARQMASDTPLSDLNEVFKGRMRRKIIKRLFKKDEHDFVSFLDQINGLETWKDASRLIDDEFYNRSINPYSKEAIAFSDTVYLRFFPKDKYVMNEEDSGKFD